MLHFHIDVLDFIKLFTRKYLTFICTIAKRRNQRLIFVSHIIQKQLDERTALYIRRVFLIGHEKHVNKHTYAGTQGIVSYVLLEK